MELGTLSPGLEARLGVQQKGIETWQFSTVDDAITINKRMLLRTSIPTGYFWKGVDPFAQAPFIFYERPVPEMDGFSLVKTTPVFASDGSYRMDNGITTDANGNLVGGPQAQASEMIFSLPNGLQGYLLLRAVRQPDHVVLAAVHAACEAALLTMSKAGSEYGFAHPLLREVLYARLPAATRAELHGRVGEALESLRVLDPTWRELAYHFRQALA